MLYLDTEFNGHGGQLISLALVTEKQDGPEFYGVLPLPKQVHPWVAEHVIPKLEREPEDMELFRFRLFTFLQRRNDHIMADWPADHMHLLNCMLGPGFETSWSKDFTLLLVTQTNPKPVNPHNALSDARALRDWHRASKKAMRVNPT
jgi:hypothetical protein